ncbi:MAG: THUMP domain-containing protein [Candidatus Heimdallarchaeaceae archaeon]
MKNNQHLLLVRFSEIGIKSKKTRHWFTSILVNHIKYCLNYFNIQDFSVLNQYSRIYILTNELEKAEKIVTSFVPGVKSTSKTIKCPSKLKEIKTTIEKQFLNAIQSNSSFAVRVKRVGTHSFTSMELAAEIGSFILEKCSNNKLKVDLTSPQYTLFIEVREKDAYLFHRKEEGLGGLPVGCQGKVLVLVEGKKEDLTNIIKMYQRGTNTVVCSLKPLKNFDKTYLNFIELILNLQPKMLKEQHLIVLENQKNLIEEIRSYYLLTNSQAIVMSRDLFYWIEQRFPVTIPIFVPDLAEKPDFENVNKILKTIK